MHIQNLTLLLGVFLWLYIPAKSQDTSDVVYLDKLWRKTSESDASYFRKYVQSVDSYVMLDYYKSGQLQMIGKYEDSKFVLETDTFRFYYANGRLKKEGSYEHGIPIGKWIGWREDGSKDFVCTYKKATHKCAYYHPNGVVSSIEEFSGDSTLVAAQLWDESGELSTNRYLEIKPTLFGYEDGYREFFSQHMLFPEDENGNRLFGNIKFIITIDTTGKAIWEDVVGFAHPNIAHSLERAVQKMPLWSPAIIHNRKTRYELLLNFTFKEH